MAIVTKDVSYKTNNKIYTGYVADGSNGKQVPGILVCHQGGGLRDHEKERCRMLADLGYVAFAQDLYGEIATDRDHAMKLLNGLTANRPVWDSLMLMGLAQLRAQPNADASRLGAIGFCFGGMTVLELVRITDTVKCVVAFHPGMTHFGDSDARPVGAKVMVCAGQKDPLIPPEARERFLKLMADANADLQYINYSGAGHSFTDKGVDEMGIPGFNYHADTDRRSWAAMRDMFDEVLGKV
ncbi:MAG TPA: dienelactone hydrolase family protein [Rhizomicrobium sp.]|nr:dienelactone hydrolase family protein [Rhizomicrobium sp.]